MYVVGSLFKYKSGTYYDSSCTASGSQGGHAVTIVGYTDGAWIVKNSWGGNWGSRGYFYMKKTTSGACGMYRRGAYSMW
jgi:C1A family cysteine protease